MVRPLRNATSETIPNSPKMTAKIRLALTSAGGARRHAVRRGLTAPISKPEAPCKRRSVTARA